MRPEDLIEYGLKPELVGRLSSIAMFHPLTIADKVAILTEAERSPLTKYIQLVELKGHRVVLDEDVPTLIAGYCPEETGARALSAICNDLFTEILYEPTRYADAEGTIRITRSLAVELITLFG